MDRRGAVGLLLAVAWLALGGCASPRGADVRAASRTLTVKGSDTLVDLTKRWAQSFMRARPDVRIQVTGGGSGTGLAALENGITDVAMSSRHITAEERARLEARHGHPPIEVPVALDGVAFFINDRNPVQALTLEQLKSIFVGDTTRWSQLGGPDRPIAVYTRENSSGTWAFVKEHLLRELDFAPSSMPMPGTGGVVNAVSQEKWGIGFGGAAFARGVVTAWVLVDGERVTADAAGIRSRRYPLSRELFFYLADEPEGDVKAFLDHVRSEAGQAQATRAGFYPL